MPDDVLNTDPPASAAPPAPRGQRFKCVFCDCVMTGDGESIWSMGARAKEYDAANTKHAKAIEKLNGELETLRSELAAVKAERDALKGSGGANPTRHRPGNRVA